MDQVKLEVFVDRWLEAWTAQDPHQLLSFYADKFSYLDPATITPITDHDVMRRYLQKLFDGWTMTWKRRAVYRLADSPAAALLWRATIQRTGKEQIIEVDGMDFIVFRDGLIAENEVYFDRTKLLTLMKD